MMERNFSLLPRASYLLKWMSGATVVVGGVNTVTGATSTVQLLEGYDNTTGYVGEYFRVSFASSDHVVKSYKLGGSVPEGLSLSPIVNEYGVGTIDGVPTTKGVYNLDIWAYKKQNLKGESALLAITVYIRENGPNILSQPQSASVAWGTAFSLDVELQDSSGTSYQWRKDSIDIPGATASTYSINQAKSSAEGLYDVQITRDEITVTSDAASVVVLSSGIQRWRETVFEDPFSSQSEAQLDPDLDGLINLIEYAIGSDPLSPTVVQLSQVGFQRVLSKEYVVYSYQKNPDAIDVSISAEYTDELANPLWIPVTDSLNGIRVENTSNTFVIKVPRETACFVRFVIAET